MTLSDIHKALDNNPEYTGSMQAYSAIKDMAEEARDHVERQTGRTYAYFTKKDNLDVCRYIKQRLF